VLRDLKSGCDTVRKGKALLKQSYNSENVIDFLQSTVAGKAIYSTSSVAEG